MTEGVYEEMEMRKKIPIGIENFEKLRSDDFYYIDKTGMIRELLNNGGEVSLFTRPRRFGKALNMSMLERFFSLDGDKRIFDGLDITKETALCEGYMGKYPVISVSLKGIDARSYEIAHQMAVRDLFETQIMESFKEDVRENREMLDRFCDALQNGDAETVEKIFTAYLRRTISIRDTAVRTDMKENLPSGKATTKGPKRQDPSVCFYHGVLLGILGVKTRWGISSNREMGEGYADILAEPDTGDMGIIIEVKYAHDGDLDGACKKALKQIGYTKYEDDLKDDGVEDILKYGIACYKKRCRVMLAEKQIG